MAETAKIRVQVDVLDIEVNDNGDIVKLPVSDSTFSKRLYMFANGISEKAKELETVDQDDILSVVDKNIEFTDYMHTEFNVLFGDRAYEKVFGDDITVSADYVLEFLEQIMPFLDKYAKKRSEKLNKYNASRVGSSL